MSHQELVDLKDMYYLRMIKAESALDAFVRDALTVAKANQVLAEAKKAVQQHITKYKD
jgi:hypothetical protein